jgi:hypothetical protein
VKKEENKRIKKHGRRRGRVKKEENKRIKKMEEGEGEGEGE